MAELRRVTISLRTEPKRVVTLVCDTGSRYLSKVYNDSWVAEQGLVDRKMHGDLRDLIARGTTSGDTVTVGPTDTLLTAYNRMRAADVSQRAALICTFMSAIWNAIASCSAIFRPKVSRVCA